MFAYLDKEKLLFYSHAQIWLIFLFILLVFLFPLMNIVSKGQINKTFLSKTFLVFEVEGKVKYPGFFTTTQSISVREALQRAGVTGEIFSLSSILLTSSVSNASKISFDNVLTVKTLEPEKFILFFIPFDINVINEDQLKILPSIGRKLAKNIIEYRNNLGRFNSIEELKNVDGIGEEKYKIIEQYIQCAFKEKNNGGKEKSTKKEHFKKGS
jgi:competence ComEA-like helix-hairpin-helix protein